MASLTVNFEKMMRTQHRIKCYNCGSYELEVHDDQPPATSIRCVKCGTYQKS